MPKVPPHFVQPERRQAGFRVGKSVYIHIVGSASKAGIGPGGAAVFEITDFPEFEPTRRWFRRTNNKVIDQRPLGGAIPLEERRYRR